MGRILQASSKVGKKLTIKAAAGDGEMWGSWRTIRKRTQNPLLELKENKKKKKNQGWFHLIVAGRKPTRAVCSGWSYPIQAELSLVLGGVPVLPTFRGSSCGSSACRMDGKFGCSLVCIGNVLSLAVVSTALQKLHKCVTQNTTELLRTQKRVKKKKKGTVF